ncbi:HDIG domain-containing metalloprotein [Alicyclobacillus sp.]|uniref:HD family phosphohydrolase n=1 Tax=Alicyclobacillus sp. TaxID=61169 RepID=UPI0025C51E43|nr:HDIG domain-containing metalloprotein [Alicyclobacillus sp.]MCL6516355.1 HDIG domain-containing protein [Alicyclobacillus sp.]
MNLWASWSLAIRRFLDDPRFRDSRRVRRYLYAGALLVLYLVLVGTVLPPRYDFRVGQVSPVTIRAPITAVDTKATEEERQAAMAKVPKQYVQSPAVEQQALQQVDELYSTAVKVVSDKHLTQAERIESLAAAAPKQVSQSTLQALVGMDSRQIGILQSVSDRIVHDLLDQPFNEEAAQQASLLVDRQMLNYDLDRVSRLIVQNVVTSVLRPNMVYQPEATDAARQAAAKAVPEKYIHKGQVIVNKNEVITDTVLSQLKDVGLYRSRPNYGVMAGFALFMVILGGLLATYIERRGSRRRLDNLSLLMVALILILMVLIIRVAKGIVNAGGPQSVSYLVPMSMGAMLITVLIDASLALVTSFFTSLWFGAAFGFDYGLALVSFTASLVGAYTVNRVTHRGTFMRAGFLVSLVQVATVLALSLTDTGAGGDWHSTSLHIGLAALGGLESAILTIGILPFFEGAFGLLTAIRLLELSNPNNPLLKKLLMEAPGTYHHSLIVGNLAEAAAELVGADPLLCRVGAYYHDVGKTRRPLFFVENQMTKDNPHDRIAPSLSHLIITSHVSDGLEMLEKAGLPKPIRDICATHHGTTILWYFYNKAREMDKNGTVKVDDFRYPGPKPKTRECAILMICDAVEAAVRSMSKPTPNRVEGVIRKIIRDRLQDGQLDECDLTLQDLDAMVGAFMKTLKGIYHARIEYPDPDKIRKEVSR